MITDHYQVLGIHPGATVEEIQAAYRRVMRAHHPDRRPGDEAAAEIARRANDAWRVLGDAERRGAYEVAVGHRRPPSVQRVTAASIPDPYSADGHRYRRAFHTACVKVAVVIFVLGLATLMTV